MNQVTEYSNNVRELVLAQYMTITNMSEIIYPIYGNFKKEITAIKIE